MKLGTYNPLKTNLTLKQTVVVKHKTKFLEKQIKPVITYVLEVLMGNTFKPLTAARLALL